MVISNLIGCAAYHGKKNMLESLIKMMGKHSVDNEAVEKLDLDSKEKKYVREFARYTPLMLAVAKGDKCLECVKTLLQNEADSTVKDEDGNNLLHIAASNGNNKILDYLSKNLKINIFDRNNQGETPLNICQSNKNSEGAKILEQYTDEYDSSKKQAEELLDEIQKEEEMTEEARAKRRQKKWRQKINKLAKQENKSPEEIE